MTVITESNFNEVVSTNKVVFIDFYANWCGPCKMMAPLVEQLDNEYSDKVTFGKCDIDENMGLAQQFRVMSIPTFMIFKDGEAVKTIVGGTSKADLEEIIKAYI